MQKCSIKYHAKAPFSHLKFSSGNYHKTLVHVHLGIRDSMEILSRAGISVKEDSKEIDHLQDMISMSEEIIINVPGNSHKT